MANPRYSPLPSDRMKSFASDNNASVHPEIMEALQLANQGHVPAYGADEFTQRAIQKINNHFGSCEVFFVFNGTGANVAGLRALTKSYNAIISSELAHINVDESTAPELFTGCKILPIPTEDGKIYPEQIEKVIKRRGDQHHPQAKVISISQPTEYATVYSVDELIALRRLADKYDLFFHMDGARLCNAAVSLDLEFREFTKDVGVDILSFGGTKNGLMYGEAVLIFRPDLAEDFKYIRKQALQLASKERFISVQFDALLTNDLWRRNAAHANKMATLLEKLTATISGITITQKVQANGIFATLPKEIILPLQKKSFFYVWNEETHEVRWMCSWDTTEEEVEQFSQKMRELLT